MLSSMDDYPVHQIAEVVRHAGTSDRNFYDRYYFNMHNRTGEIFVVIGMGQYPNLGVQDAFALVLRGRKHKVVRASRILGDRGDNTVGPLRVEVIEGLKKVRCVLEPNEHGMEFDLTWEGAMPAHLEPRMFIRRYGRVLFDTQRFAQTGSWSGTLRVGEESFKITPDRWWGTRDRSWGVRPVGEMEHPGIRQAEPSLDGMWNYAPMRFKDYSLLYMCLERDSGERELEEGVRIWHDPARGTEHFGRPEHHHVFRPGTSVIERSVLSFPHAPGGPIEIRVQPLINCYVGIGTGYGYDIDWRHGMYQGPLVVQGVEYDTVDNAGQLWGICDSAARFEVGSDAGYGLHEYGFFGPFRKYNI